MNTLKFLVKKHIKLETIILHLLIKQKSLVNYSF